VGKDYLLRAGCDTHATVAAVFGVNKVYAVTVAMYRIHWAHLGADAALGAGPHLIFAWRWEMGDDGQGSLLGIVISEKV